MILDSISMIQSGNWREAIIQILLTLPVIMSALAWHEAAHGYVAYKFGDPTARNLGRLTLNPAKHIDPMGFLAMMVLGFGWAKPVPINPRYALYQSKYTFLLANKADAPKDYLATIAGRCCESGDLLGERVEIQKAVRGDILAVLVTGAYNFAMASNYNRLPRPPVVFVKDGKARLVVRRESYADLVRNDIF